MTEHEVEPGVATFEVPRSNIASILLLTLRQAHRLVPVKPEAIAAMISIARGTPAMWAREGRLIRLYPTPGHHWRLKVYYTDEDEI